MNTLHLAGIVIDGADMVTAKPLAGNRAQVRLDIDIDHANSQGILGLEFYNCSVSRPDIW
jgi:hypothetical protein